MNSSVALPAVSFRDLFTHEDISHVRFVQFLFSDDLSTNTITEDEPTIHNTRHTERLPTITEGTSKGSDSGTDGALSLICQHQDPVLQDVLKKAMVDADELHRRPAERVRSQT